MFKFPYLSIDIETSGLNTEKSHVLQLAAVYDNGGPIEELPTFNRVICWPVLTWAEITAVNMNKRLMEKAYNNEKGVLSVDAARFAWKHFLDSLALEGKFFAAGKNVASFDIPILKNHTNLFDMSRISHRVLDPGSMYSENFDHIPNLNEINKITGRKEVSHDALDDAMDVVYAIRYKWGVPV